MLRRCGRQTTSANHPANTPKQYWKVSLYFAFIDQMIMELESHFISSENSFFVQYLLPCVVGNITNEQIATLFETYETDLAFNLDEFNLEVARWRTRWYSITPCDQMPTSLCETLNAEGTSTKNFAEAYRALRKVIEDYSELDKSWLHEFWRCCLPNGKIAYLCKDHMSKVGATKIRYGTRRVQHVLTDQDKHFKDVLSENPVILQLKQEGITMKNDEKKEIEPKTIDNSHGENAGDQSVPSENYDSRIIQSRESSAQSDTSQQSTSSKRSQKSQRRTSQACSLQ
ncbi:unnamed protein product [Mytilus coruscus]|uniref:Uncharacterized protein n=1 Tax=Mytilus coruscus TaxID=42192 RepID=A0A6J8CHQ1_MYTCO|nr:unnamed protein product [Mytilus coruscus]